jgi:hypothetical protein
MERGEGDVWKMERLWGKGKKERGSGEIHLLILKSICL